MKTHFIKIKAIFALTVSAMLSISSQSFAATLTWDANGATALQTDGLGVWLNANQWWNGSSNVTWTSGDDAVFGNGGTGGAVTLASGTTVGSIAFNSFSGTYTIGTAGSTITLNNGITMNSGAGVATIISPITLGGAQSWTNNDDSLLTIGTGAVSNAGYLLTIGGSGNTTVSSVISGAGGLTKSGSGTLTLSGSNSFTGQLTVSNGTLSIGSINNINSTGTLGNHSQGLPIILGSSGNTGTLQYTAASGSSDKWFTLASGGTGGFNITTALTLSGLINGSGGLSKTGAGTLTLSNNANPFSGNTVITNGKLALGAQYALWNSAYDTTGSTGAIGLTATGQVAPWLGGVAGSVDLATAITGYGSITTLTLNPQSGSSVSYGGIIANGAVNMNLTKTGPGTQTLTGTNTYSGATTVWAGTLGFAGSSGSATSSAFTVNGGTLLLDNSAGTWVNRISDSAALSLGSLTLNSDNGGVARTETVGATTFAVGGKVTINNGTGAGTTLSMGAVTRSAGAAIDFVGTGGTLGSGASNPNVTASSGLTNTNGILDWATVGGTQWAESNSNSIRAYSGSFTAINSSTNAQNAQVSGSESLSGARVGNSLNLIATAAGQSLSLGANNLTLGSAAGSAAAILKSGTEAYTISGTGQVRAGSAGAGTELIAHVNGGALTISAPLNTAILGIAKGGTGDLILSGTRAGTLSGAIGIAGGQLEFQGASTTISGGVSGAGGITVNLNAGQTLLFNTSNLRYSGPTIVKGGILSIGNGYTAMINFPGVSGASLASNGQGLLSNLELNGGSVTVGYYMSEFLGSGPGQIQLTGGTSGFSNSQGDAAGNMWTINGTASYEVVWGSPFFKPDALLLGAAGASHAQTFTIPNRFDLNGATRTFATDVAAFGGTLTGVIGTSSGTAGITKTGIGPLVLTGVNTFNGPVTINGGTLSVSNLANGGSNSALGSSSNAAANLLLGNATTLRYTGGAVSADRSFTINGTAAGHGASLDASGSGAVNFTNTASPAYGTVDQTRTLTLTGTYAAGNNTLAANIADNGAGAVSLNKTGAGLWVLSGTSSYTGPTTLNAGTLSVSTASNLGNAASNLVFNGGTLQISSTTNLPNFVALGRTVSFTSGQTVGLDITSGTFTANQVLNQGSGGLSKAGAGILVLNSAHSYTGQTTVSAGTLQLDDNGVFSAAPLFLNGGTFAVNRSTTATLGSTLPAIVGGTGSLANIAESTLVLNAPTFHTGNTTATAGNITLSHANAIQNSALNTTGAGTFTLSGVTTPTFGGLANSGTTRNLASVIDSSYANVTSLTLKPESGMTYTYGGEIANGANGMALTKTGAGTQVLQGANSYSGVTTIKNGTLTLSGASGSILNSAITLSGGSLLLSNATGQSAVNRVSNSAIITSNGGNLTVTNPSGDNTANWAETLGALSLNSGQLNIISTNAVNAARSQILTFGSGSLTTINGVARTVSNTSAITFSGTSLGTTADDNNILITSQSDTAANQIIGAWATYGTSAAAQTDYATYNITGGTGNSRGIQGAGIAGSAETTWTTAANAYTTSAGGTVTLTGTRTISALRNTGATTVLTLATGANLETYGLLNGVATLLTVAPGTGGVLTTPTGGGSLHVNAGSGAITINAPINNNGGNVTLVKNGSGTLTLGATGNYSGGTVINGGVLSTTADEQLGASGGIIVNGTSQWTMGAATTVTYARSLTVNDGAVLTLSSGNASKTVTGVLSGNGSIIGAASTGYIFSNTNNTFTGRVDNGYQMLFASIGDSSNAINLVGSNSEFQWTGGAKAFALRPLTLNAAGTGNFNNNGTGAVTFAQDLAFSGAAGARTLALGGTYTGGTNVFFGNVTDGPGSAVSLTKNGAGAWRVSGNLSNTGGVNVNAGGVLTLTGTNTYSGNTTFSGNGTFLTLAGVQAASPNTFYNMNTGASSSTTTIKLLDDTDNVNGRTTTFPGTFRNNSNNTPGASTNFIVGNNNTANGGTGSGTTTGSTIAIGTLDWGSEATGTTAYGPINIQGTNGYRMFINNVLLYKATNVTSGTVGNTAFVPTTANVTIGNVTMDTGNTGQGYQTFVMDGTSSDNWVMGTISNASDFATSNRELRVTKSNTSTWSLTGSNTYTGVTTVSGGTLNVYDLVNGGSNSNIGASSSAAGNLILNGGTLRYMGGGGYTDRLFSLQTSSAIDASGSGPVYFTNSGSMGFNAGTAAKTLTLTGTNTSDNTIAAIIGDNTGATAITKSGIGTWVLSATNTNSGATSVSGGGNLILDYGTNDTNKIAGVLSLGGGTLTARGATGTHVEVVTSTSLNAGGTFLTRDGANTAKFRMNAITRAAGGTISFGSATLADTDTNNVNSILGGWATLGNDWAVSANSGAADTAVTALGSYTTWVNSTGSATANYLLNGNGSIVTTGVAANTVKISNSSNSETLALNNLNLTITSASATSLGGIMYAGGSDGLYSITGGTGRIQTSAANQELIFAVQTGTLSVGAFVGASGSSGIVTKSGNGTLAISSANNYTGATRVNQGVLRLANATAAGTTAGGITVENGAALEMANNISVEAEAVTLTGAGVSNGGALRNIASNASSYAGAITLGAGGARINSDANGVLTLTGGVVTSLFNDVTFGGAGNTTVSTAAISGAGGLIKDGAGITTLTATNTYTGATRVSNGILSIGTVASPTGSINSSALTINGGNFRNNSATNYTGALTFTSGTISGTNWGGSLNNLAIGSDEIISPGNSPGTAVTGSQTWAGGGTYVWEINSTLGTAGADPGWDLINGSGTLNVTALAELGFNINVTSLTTGNLAGQVSDFDQSLNYNWLIADFATVTGFSSDKFVVNTGSFANAFTGSFAVALGDSGTIGGDNSQIWLTYTAIPEPKAALLGGIGLLLLLRRRRQ